MKINPRSLAMTVAIMLLFPLLSFAGELENHITKGGQFVQAKDYKKAAKEYEAAVALNPKNSKANLLLGLTYANTGDLDKAIQYSEASVKAEPSYAGYYNLGLIYAEKTDFEKSIQAYQEALKLNPKAYQAWHQLGKVYASQGEFAKAIEAYGQAVKLNPQFGDAYQGLGSAYYWSGDKTSALKQVGALKAVKMNDKADQLENWLNAKEAKKKPAAPAPAVPSR